MIAPLPRNGRRFVFIPPSEARNTAHLVVDDGPMENTVLELSHWPGNRTPDAFRADLSATSVRLFLAGGGRVSTSHVTTRHFDIDSVLSVYMLTRFPAIESITPCLEDASRLGDFGRSSMLDSVRLCALIRSMQHRQRTLVSNFRGLNDSADVYRAIDATLGVLDQALSDLNGYESVWIDEWKFFVDSMEALTKIELIVDEYAALDLAVMRSSQSVFVERSDRLDDFRAWPVHPYALFARSERSNRLVLLGSYCLFQFGYESWVDFVSRGVPRRRDLSVLASELGKCSDGRESWVFQGIDDFYCKLYPVAGKTALSHEAVIQRLIDTLS